MSFLIGLVVPTDRSFNLDAFSAYPTLAAVANGIWEHGLELPLA